ncbi:lipopolysaccharide biosynthesis protein [Alkalimarinus coralli]|uniref:lipopolysaccharide biosynthesis protein n=1 Tax=Alkalimarinus coralli TaxID=2935863 RepID=UPI00202B1C51|nr:oligosaccharide flippase family protein [Alkalimarinus coralli]
MKLPKLELAINLTARLVAAVLSFLVVPFYTELLGVEAYGLIGFFTTFQAIFFLLEMGVVGAFVRQTAMASESSRERGGELKKLASTLNTLFLILGFVVSILVYYVSGLIAENWVSSDGLPHEHVERAIQLMGVVIGAQFPFLIYQAGLLGLHKHLQLNVLLIVVALLRYLGALIILMSVESSITAYFAWQLLVSLFQSAISKFLLWRNYPRKAEVKHFDIDQLKKIWRFSAGMAGIAMTTVAMMQVDKVVVSGVLSLTEFGYYSMAVLIASVPLLVAGPFYNVYYPKLSQFVSVGNQEKLVECYHQGAQLIAAFIIPLGGMIALFAEPISLIWIRDQFMSSQISPLITILCLGTTLAGVMHIPYSLQIAHGWTKLTFRANLIAVMLMIPLMMKYIPEYGAIAACYCWLLMNVGFVVFNTSIMHRRLLIGEIKRWYIQSLLLPTFGVLIIGMILVDLFYQFEIDRASTVSQIAYLNFSFIVLMFIGMVGTPASRQILFSILQRGK